MRGAGVFHCKSAYADWESPYQQRCEPPPVGLERPHQRPPPLVGRGFSPMAEARICEPRHPDATFHAGSGKSVTAFTVHPGASLKHSHQRGPTER